MEIGTKVKLCTNNTWCPEVERDARGVVIRDDNKGVVILSREEWNILVDKVKTGELEAI